MSFDCTNGRDVAKALGKYVNSFHIPDEKEFVDYITSREHRTLQQNIFKLFLKCIEEWSKKEEGWFDLRNEATIKMCKKIAEIEGVSSKELPYI